MEVGWITLVPLLCGAFYSLSAFSDLSDCIKVTVFICSLLFGEFSRIDSPSTIYPRVLRVNASQGIIVNLRAPRSKPCLPV